MIKDKIKNGEKIKLDRKKYIAISVIFFILIIMYLSFLSSKSKKISDKEVIVFALDAGDWRIVNKLLSENKLHNLKYLIDDGASGKLKVVEPIYTPPNMASLFSGKLPYQHGIMTHFDTGETGNKNQLYRNMKVKPLWAILSNTSIKLDLVGFQEFDYAPRIDGDIITGFYLIKKVASHNNYLEDTSNEMNFLRYIPDSILVSKKDSKILTNYTFLDNSKTIMKKNNLTLDFDTEITRRMQPYVIERLKETEKLKKNNLEFSKLTKGLETFFESNITAKFVFEYDMLSKEIALDLHKNHKPNILFVYFSGTDVFGHNYYFEGWQLDDKKDEQRQIYKYYEIIDGYIGEFINNSDEKTTFIVISDHGLQNMSLNNYLNPRLSQAPHTKYGIFIAKGEGIKHNYKTDNADIVDITPTLLYMFDKPIALDFDGEPLLDIFEDNYKKGKSIHKIDTYG